VAAAGARGAIVVTPATLGVGLLEFHQLDRMVEAGRAAARTLLDQAGGDLAGLRQPTVAEPVPHVPSRETTATVR
jgi:hypothetical protein